MKKKLALLLALVMILSLVPASVFANGDIAVPSSIDIPGSVNVPILAPTGTWFDIPSDPTIRGAYYSITINHPLVWQRLNAGEDARMEIILRGGTPEFLRFVSNASLDAGGTGAAVSGGVWHGVTVPTAYGMLEAQMFIEGNQRAIVMLSAPTVPTPGATGPITIPLPVPILVNAPMHRLYTYLWFVGSMDILAAGNLATFGGMFMQYEKALPVIFEWEANLGAFHIIERFAGSIASGSQTIRLTAPLGYSWGLPPNLHYEAGMAADTVLLHHGFTATLEFDNTTVHWLTHPSGQHELIIRTSVTRSSNPIIASFPGMISIRNLRLIPHYTAPMLDELYVKVQIGRPGSLAPALPATSGTNLNWNAQQINAWNNNWVSGPAEGNDGTFLVAARRSSVRPPAGSGVFTPVTQPTAAGGAAFGITIAGPEASLIMGVAQPIEILLRLHGANSANVSFRQRNGAAIPLTDPVLAPSRHQTVTGITTPGGGEFDATMIILNAQLAILRITPHPVSFGMSALPIDLGQMFNIAVLANAPDAMLTAYLHDVGGMILASGPLASFGTVLPPGSGDENGDETGNVDEPTPTPSTPMPPVPQPDQYVTIANPQAPGQVHGALEDYLSAADEEPSVVVVLPDVGNGLNIQVRTLDMLYEAGASLTLVKGDATVTLTAETLSEISEWGSGTVNINIIASESDEGFADIEVVVTSGNRTLEHFETPVAIAIDIGNVDDYNHYRIVAMAEDGTIIGGRFNPDTGLFEIETPYAGKFTISYIEGLRRLNLRMDSNLITDPADNAARQVMDVMPIIVGNRTLIPMRFVAYALGAEVDWLPATGDSPLTVFLTLGDKTLSFGVGEVTPELAALGMDVPAQIIDNRTMVPLRFISEFFGAMVTWDEETRRIEIIKG